MILKGWERKTIGEIIELVGGGTPRTSEPTFWNGNIPWLSVVDFNNGNRWVNKTEKNITELGLKNSSTKMLNKGDLIISARGTVGALAQLKIPMAFNQSCYGIKEKKGISDINFLYYLIKNSYKVIEKNTHGAVFDTITKETFNHLFCLLPPLPEQQAIASVLFSFDDKIGLIRAENQTLEEMGQTLFKERFEYKVGDDLPEDWEEYELSELVDTINGYSYKGDELVEKSNEALVTLKSFDRNGGFQTRGFKEFSGTPKKEHEVFIGDLVVAHTDLTQDAEVLGNPAFIVNDGGFEKLYITMDLVKVEPKNENISKSFLYFLMKTREFKGHCVGYSNGTTVLHLSKKAIPEFKIVLPKDLSGLKEKSVSFDLIMRKISHNFSQIDELTETRDQLLPKLMSGEVRVEF